jgi:hypothetical protein
VKSLQTSLKGNIVNISENMDGIVILTIALVMLANLFHHLLA